MGIRNKHIPAVAALHDGRFLHPENLHIFFRVNFTTGKLHWKHRPAEYCRSHQDYSDINIQYEGQEAFITNGGEGYLMGSIFGRNYKAHRVIMAMKYGVWPDQTDHINGIRSDNRLENLRDVDVATNNRNQKRMVINTSGTTGVGWDSSKNRWRVRIWVAGKRKHIGWFVDKGAAVAAREAASIKYDYHENHGRH